jgi:hypothetical protein
VVVVFPGLFEVVVVVIDPVTVPALHFSPSATTILSTVTVTEVHDFGGTLLHPKFHPFELTVNEFIRTRREGAYESKICYCHFRQCR